MALTHARVFVTHTHTHTHATPRCRYGGLGGSHVHNGWTIDFEAAPLTGYCNPKNYYGSNNFRRLGGHFTLSSSCGSASGRRKVYMDFTIETYAPQ